MRTIVLLFLVLFVVEARVAFSQESNVLEFEVFKDPVTGIYSLREKGGLDLGHIGAAGRDESESAIVRGHDKILESRELGYAYSNKDGELVEVFVPPVTSSEKDYIFDKLKEGGTLAPVNFFGGRSLPTSEEVKKITQDAINAATSLICSTDPKPETLIVDVGLAVDLGVQGHFKFTMEWKPNRDC